MSINGRSATLNYVNFVIYLLCSYLRGKYLYFKYSHELLDPDPHTNPVPDRGGHKWPKKIGKRIYFSSFEVLDVLFWGLKASPVLGVLFSECVFLSQSTVPYLFSLFGTCFHVKKYGTVPFFFILDVLYCQICRYRTFFLYSEWVLLSKSTLPYLFSLFGTCFLVKKGTVPAYFTRKHVPNKEKRYGTVLFDKKTPLK